MADAQGERIDAAEWMRRRRLRLMYRPTLEWINAFRDSLSDLHTAIDKWSNDADQMSRWTEVERLASTASDSAEAGMMSRFTELTKLLSLYCDAEYPMVDPSPLSKFRLIISRTLAPGALPVPSAADINDAQGNAMIVCARLRRLTQLRHEEAAIKAASEKEAAERKAVGSQVPATTDAGKPRKSKGRDWPTAAPDKADWPTDPVTDSLNSMHEWVFGQVVNKATLFKYNKKTHYFIAKIGIIRGQEFHVWFRSTNDFNAAMKRKAEREV